MRWPWQPALGKVRVSHRRLIELLRDALRAAELEQEATATRAQAQAMEAQTRALELLNAHDGGPARAQLLARLPFTADGRLHEEAFLVLVEAEVWGKRDQELREILSASG